jgi:hypothetical protein
VAKITLLDVTRPNAGHPGAGDLAPVMFRGVYSKADFDTAVQGWIDTAAKKVKAAKPGYDAATGDELELLKNAEKAWVYHQAYLSLASLTANLPNQASEVNLQSTFSNPAKENRALAAQWLETFKALIPDAVLPTSSLKRRSSSSSVFETDF